MPQKKKREHVPPGKWMGPPNSSGVRAGESFFERSPTQRKNKRGASALQRGKMTSPRSPSPRNNKRGTPLPTHIGMLPNNLILEINGIAGRGKLGQAIESARIIRSMKGFQLLPWTRRRGSLRGGKVVYDPTYHTVFTPEDINVNSTWWKTAYNLSSMPLPENMQRAGYINRTPRSRRNSRTHNEIESGNRLSTLRQHAAKAGRTSMEKVKDGNVRFYSMYHPNMKMGPHR